jgi:hypothetical protein
MSSRRDVDGVSHGVVGVVAVLADHDRPRVDGDADGEVDAVGLLHVGGIARDRPLDRHPRANGALGVVLVRERRAEHGVELVADELDDRSVVALDLRAHHAQNLAHEQTEALRAEPLRDRRRADDVGEEHGHDPALACNHRHAGIVRVARARREGRCRPQRGTCPARRLLAYPPP